METNQTKDDFSNPNYSAMEISSDIYIETESAISLYVKDYGRGKPVILIHGWPLSGEMWEYQIEALVMNNYRVITYDRRGYGKSSQPWDGHDYNSLVEDLKTVIDELELTDVTLVGFSMGGGEVARYLGRYGSNNISKAVFISSVTPFMLKTDDNPDGMPQEAIDKMAGQIREDRIDFLDGFGKTFYGVGLLSKPVSVPFLQHDLMIASCASPHATLQSLKAFSSTDFRGDLPKIDIPVLMIHGDSDKTVPIEISSEKAAKLIPDCRYLVYGGAPHGLFYTEKERLNQDLVEFLNS
jgi:pimeloyl-ACP methyl ester carboxylesterase